MRIAFYFSPLPTDLSQQLVNGQTIPQEYTSKYVAAFAIDWIRSIAPTLMNLFVALLIIVLIFKTLIFCAQIHPHTDNVDTTEWFSKTGKNKALPRLVALDWNCPCFINHDQNFVFKCTLDLQLLFSFYGF